MNSISKLKNRFTNWLTNITNELSNAINEVLVETIIAIKKLIEKAEAKKNKECKNE